MGLREQKHEDTRQRMVDAARQLFDEHGYDATTVEMIAVAAGVSPRTFHRYFDTKDGVVAEGGSRIVGRAIELLPAAPTVADIVRSLAAATEEGLDSEEVEWSVRLRRENAAIRISTPVWMHRWTEAVARALASKEGYAEPTLSHRVKSAAAVHVSAVAADEWVLRDPSRKLSRLAERAIRILEEDMGLPAHYSA